MQFTVTVKPGTSQEKILPQEDGSFVIYLRAKPHDGEANTALIKLISKHLHVPKTSIKIIRGQNSRQKVLEIAS